MVLIWIILITNGIEQFLYVSWSFVFPLLWNSSSCLLPTFLLDSLRVFSLLFWMCSLHILNTNPLWLYVLQWSFLKDWEKWFVFSFSYGAFKETEFLNLKRAYLLKYNIYTKHVLKKTFEILVGVALTLKINLGKVDIFTVLLLPTHPWK